jgi:hypothetical protein
MHLQLLRLLPSVLLALLLLAWAIKHILQGHGLNTRCGPTSCFWFCLLLLYRLCSKCHHAWLTSHKPRWHGLLLQLLPRLLCTHR